MIDVEYLELLYDELEALGRLQLKRREVTVNGPYESARRGPSGPTPNASSPEGVLEVPGRVA